MVAGANGVWQGLQRAWRLGRGGSSQAEASGGENVLGMRVDDLEQPDAVDAIIELAAQPRQSGVYVCAANVHMAMEAWDDDAFRDVVNNAALVLPDGVPIVWALRLLGATQRRRVRVAPDLVDQLFARCLRQGLPVALYGGSPESLREFRRVLDERYPGLRLSATVAPPYRTPTAEEDAAFTRELAASGARLIFAGIGCPKQERWMAAHAAELPAVMIGVGAAFDLFSGRRADAPAWTRNVGLEWAWRLAKEPRRLWRRHVYNDPRFLALLMAQAIARRLRARMPDPVDQAGTGGGA